MAIFRFQAMYVGEIEAPNEEVARQIVMQQVSASMALATQCQNFGGGWAAQELTPEILAKEAEEKRKLGKLFKA